MSITRKDNERPWLVVVTLHAGDKFEIAFEDRLLAESWISQIPAMQVAQSEHYADIRSAILRPLVYSDN